MNAQIKFTNSLKHKFPLPESNKERALAVILIGIAIFLGSVFDPMRDYLWRLSGESTQAHLVRSDEYKGAGPKQLIGIYEFSDQYGGKFEVISKSVFANHDKIPKQAEAIWHLGEPQKARIAGDYGNRLIPSILGIIVIIGGVFVFVREKRKITQK